MSATGVIEQLQNEKMRLEDESRVLDEEIKQLEMRWKILGEKVAIQQLRNENTAKKETIDQLESKIGLLETRLEKLLASGVFKKEARLHVKMLRDKNP
jgi:predicted nuclease with TOPRIM domain